MIIDVARLYNTYDAKARGNRLGSGFRQIEKIDEKNKRAHWTDKSKYNGEALREIRKTHR